MAGREYCVSCKYPISVCICGALKPCSFATKVIILQHPSELQHAKNTARLVSLVSQDTEIVVGETEEDFESIRRRLEASSAAAVVFPAPESQSLVEFTAQEKLETIILIDGTWRKAKRIWHSNPWLRSMPVCRLEIESPSLYRIRKGREVGGFSTLEATALAIEAIESADTSALYDALEAMQKNWHGYQNN